ncbi:MAG: MoaD/ThiS family protein [Candidatus Micrarchaeota archaeon]
MKIKLVQGGKSKSVEVGEDKKVKSLIQKMGLNDETFLIKLNGKIAHEDTELNTGDELEFLNVIYGG